MPRKKAELPRPCPLCGRTDGTVQVVVFNPKYPSRYRRSNHTIFRIGHYDANKYAAKNDAYKHPTPLPLELEKPPKTMTDDELLRALRWAKGVITKKPSGRIWHSFTARRSYSWEVYDKIAEIYGDTRASVTFRFSQELYDSVQKNGWLMIPDKVGYFGGGGTLWIKRRAPKQYPKDIRKPDGKKRKKGKKEPVNSVKKVISPPLFPNKYPG